MTLKKSVVVEDYDEVDQQEQLQHVQLYAYELIEMLPYEQYRVSSIDVACVELWKEKVVDCPPNRNDDDLRDNHDVDIEQWDCQLCKIDRDTHHSAR